jgi:hypothetical protein
MKKIILKEYLIKGILEGKITQFRKLIIPKFIDEIEYSKGVKKNSFSLPKSLYEVGDTLFVGEFWTYEQPSNVNSKITYKTNNPFLEKLKSPFSMTEKEARIFMKITNIRLERMEKATSEDAIKEGVEYLFTQEQCDTVVGLKGTKAEDHGYVNYLWHGRTDITHKQADNHYYQSSGYSDPLLSLSSRIDRDYWNGAFNENPYCYIYEFELLKK